MLKTRTAPLGGYAKSRVGPVAMVWLFAIAPMILSLAIGGISAVLIVVDFNYLRKHGGEDDAIWLATGIFVSVVNILLSLLNLFGNR